MAWLDAGEAAILVRVERVAGSAPREAGAQMAVSAAKITGSIGGGALEDLAIRTARAMLDNGRAVETIDQPLGPDIGQCCGGRVVLTLTRATPAIAAEVAEQECTERSVRPHALIFGAGHTGGALARILATQPISLSIIDQRPDWLSPLSRLGRTTETPLPEAEVAAAPPRSAFVILTHDHALDFLIAEAALARGDAAYVGMIGSATKRATFEAALRRKGGAAGDLVCPIGGDGPRDKRPEVIALATAAEVIAALL